MSKSNGRIWPYSIAASITLIFSACVVTVFVANTLPVENSDTYMMGYHEADAKANEIIQARIAFNKKYKIEYITDGISLNSTVLKYKVTDLESVPVNNASLKVIITRPNNHKYDQELTNPMIENGVYTFRKIALAMQGRWDIMAKVNVENEQRFFNVKADTRQKEVYEY